MTTPTSQPSKVSTEEEVRPADEHVVTDDRDFFNVPSPESSEAKPAASGDTKPADQTTEKPASSDNNQQAKPQTGRDRPAERTIKKLKRELATVQSERTQDRTTIEDLQTQIDDLKTATTAAKPEPQLKDFDSPADYAKAYGKWESGQKPAASKDTDAGTGKPAARRDPDAHAQHDQPAAVPDKEILDFQTRGKSKLGDEFSEALQLKTTAVDQDMGEFMLDSEFGPEIYVHLANNPDEAKKIFDAGGTRKLRALEALEAKGKKGELDVDGDQVNITTGDDDKGGDDKGGDDKSKPAAAGEGQQTKAKDPPSDTREAGSTVAKADPENESMDDYAARRGKEEARRQGRIP